MSSPGKIRFALAKHAVFGGRNRLRFYDKLARRTRQGKKIERSIERFQLRFNARRDDREEVMRRIRYSLTQGKSVSSALAPYIAIAEQQIIQSGESAGKTHEGFERAVKHVETMMLIRSTLWSQLSYPVGIAMAIAVMLTVMSFQIIPIFLRVVPFEKWPESSVPIYYLTQGVRNYGVPALICMAILSAVVWRSLPRWRGKARQWFDHWVPPYTFYRDVNGAAFLGSLSAMTGSGVPVADAVKRLTATASPWLRMYLERVLNALPKGDETGRALRCGLFDRDVEDDIEDYADGVGFKEALDAVANDQVKDVITRITSRATLIRNVLMVVGGGLLFYMMLSVGMVAISMQSGALKG